MSTKRPWKRTWGRICIGWFLAFGAYVVFFLGTLRRDLVGPVLEWKLIRYGFLGLAAYLVILMVSCPYTRSEMRSMKLAILLNPSEEKKSSDEEDREVGDGVARALRGIGPAANRSEGQDQNQSKQKSNDPHG
jgi:hypothetical protein